MTSEMIYWTAEDMIGAACEHWGDAEPEDCEVIRDDTRDCGPCLVVRHNPTGRETHEFGDAGRWHLDGRAFGQD